MANDDDLPFYSGHRFNDRPGIVVKGRRRVRAWQVCGDGTVTDSLEQRNHRCQLGGLPNAPWTRTNVAISITSSNSGSMLAQDTTALETSEEVCSPRVSLSRANVNQWSIRTGRSCTLHDHGGVRRSYASGHPDPRKQLDGSAAAVTGLRVRLSRRYGSRCSGHRHQPSDLRPGPNVVFAFQDDQELCSKMAARISKESVSIF